jgi:hypothetical protein
MDAQLELRRPQPATRPDDVGRLEDQFAELPLVPGGAIRRFLAWADPTSETVGTAGAVTRAVVCVVLCLLAAVAIVGAVTGIVAGFGGLA